jgi:hypothetical protein
MSNTIELMTYADAIDWLVDYQRANPTSQSQRIARRAIHSAYRIFPNEHAWNYFYAVCRIDTVAPYTDGTVVYDHTGGSYERMLTLTGGIWPDWSTFGTVIIANIQYQVAERISDSVVTLTIDGNPQEDLSSTSFTLMRDTYTMPSDFISADQMYTPESWRRLKYVHPREWLVAHRYNVTSSNTPYHYTYRGSPDFMGAMAISFYPFPDSATSIDFLYRRRPRPLRVESITAGTVTVSAGDFNANGEGTNFLDEQIGAVLRIGPTNGDEYPTGREGANPYEVERVMMNAVSTTQLEVDQVFTESFSNAKYVISDPLDIEPGAMTTAFLRCCEREVAILTRLTDRAEAHALYEDSLEDAKCADVRNTAPRSVYTENMWNRRLAYMPAGEDVD